MNYEFNYLLIYLEANGKDTIIVLSIKRAGREEPKLALCRGGPKIENFRLTRELPHVLHVKWKNFT